MLTSSQTPSNIVNINTDAFLTLSKIAFSSVERLTALNLNATRAALEEGVATSSSLLHTHNVKEQQKLQTALPAKANKNAEIYLQQLQEIAAETQKEVTKLMASYFAPPSEGSNPSADWVRGFDLFKGFAEQITAMTNASSKMVGDATARIEGAKVPHSKHAG